MGLFKKVLGGAAVAGGAVAAAKIAEKVKENNPEGVQDVNGDGKVDIKDYAEEVKKASQELYGEASEFVKEKAPEVKEKVGDAAEAVKEKVEDAVECVKEKISGEKAADAEPCEAPEA